MDAGRRTGLAAALAAVALAVGTTAPAGAATVERNEAFSSFLVTDSDDAPNSLTIERLNDGKLQVTDLTTPLTTTDSADCTPAGPATTIVCEGGALDILVSLGGGDDSIGFGATILGATVNGGAGIDQITGTGGDDNLLGGDAADQIAGGDGVDQIEGGAGNDILRGGPGTDFFNLNVTGSGPFIDTDPGNDDLDGEAGSDSLNGGTGGDVMADTGTDGAKDEVNYGRGDHESAVGVTVTMGAGRNDGNAADGLFDAVGAGIEQVVGTGSRDEITGSAGADTLRGRGGDDRLAGAAGADTLTGGEGDDTLEARDGVADTLLDCDDTSGAQGTSDVAVADAVDPAPVRCEVVDRPSAGAQGRPSSRPSCRPPARSRRAPPAARPSRAPARR